MLALVGPPQLGAPVRLLALAPRRERKLARPANRAKITM